MKENPGRSSAFKVPYFTYYSGQAKSYPHCLRSISIPRPTPLHSSIPYFTIQAHHNESITFDQTRDALNHLPSSPSLIHSTRLASSCSDCLVYLPAHLTFLSSSSLSLTQHPLNPPRVITNLTPLPEAYISPHDVLYRSQRYSAVCCNAHRS